MKSIERDIPTILGEALELEDADAREAYLRQVCSGDYELRRQVDQLLDDYAAAGDFLEQPAAPSTILPETLLEGPGSRIGSYTLREQIGEGGMGIVYVVDQTIPIRRRAALKIIKPGLDTRQVIARFEGERQALALMHHPHIARILDAGATTSGRPYFVMELVRGVSITEFCDTHRYSVRQRLELFILVCQAVQHAHQKGIIHRDLKPSNVLVELHDVTPVPKIIDFGIAKATNRQLSEQTVYTSLVQIIGTPIYMSPEQTHLSGLDVDTRSDIYSLGVMLYELLTGTTPFDLAELKAEGPEAMWRIIREVEPLRPSLKVSTLHAQQLSTVSERRQIDSRRLSVTMQRELDWIVLKSLEKDRTRRYQSAMAMAADLQRYLCDEPVDACPPSLTYRVRKAARRHRLLLLTAGGMAATLLGAAAVSIQFAIQANRERDAARIEQGKAVAAEVLADARLQQSQKDVDRALDSLDTIVAELSSAEFSQLPRAERIRQDVLHKSLTFYEEIVAEHRESPHARQAQAVALLRISNMLSRDRRLVESVAAINRSVAIVDELIREFPDSVIYKELLLDILFDRAHSLGRTMAEQTADSERALSIAQELLPSARRDQITRYLHTFGIVASRLPGDSPRAGELLERSLQIAEEHGVDPLPGVLMTLAGRADREGRLQDAERFARRGISLYEKIGGDPNKRDNHVERHLAGDNTAYLASLLERMNRMEDAEAAYRCAVDAAAEVCRDFGQVWLYRETLRRHASGLSRLLRMRHDPQAAEEVVDKLLKDFPDFPELHVERAGTIRIQPAAEDLLTEAIGQFPSQPAYLRVRGTLRMNRGALDEALCDFNRALDVATDQGSREVALDQRAELYCRQGQFELAEADFSEAMTLSLSWHYFKRRANVRFRQQRFTQCMADLREGVNRNPSDLSNLTWIPPWEIAQCSNSDFRAELLLLADRVVELNHNSAASLMTRAFLRVALGDVEGAQADCHTVINSENTEHLELYQAALVELQLKNEKQYRKVCRKMMAVAGESQNEEPALYAAWTSVLAPLAVEDYRELNALAERVLAAGSDDHWRYVTHGAMMLRCGQTQAAIDSFARSDKFVPTSKTSAAYVRYLEAMAFHQLGRTPEARSALLKARQQVLQEASAESISWNRWLTCELLENQVLQTLGEAAEDSRPDSLPIPVDAAH